MDADIDKQNFKETSRSDVLRVESPVYSPIEAAAYLNLTALGVNDAVAGVSRLVKRKKLECFSMLGHRAFTREQLDRCLQQLIAESEQRKSGRRRRS